jgi:L-alanine-DL-glutamate epimerase-like enolase superfamily enzyme
VTGVRLQARAERWPIRGSFTISRGTRTEATVVVVEIRGGGVVGRGECVPYARYGESVAGVLEQIDAVRAAVEDRPDRRALLEHLPPGAARNAVDAALWDRESQRCGRPVWELADLAPPGPLVTAETISLDTPDAMGAAAARRFSRPLLKVKLDADHVVERVEAVREGAPGARLIVDANEAWSAADLERLLEPLADLGVELVEQPLPAGADGALEGLESPVTLCADESVHGVADLERLRSRYQAVNVKLDKTGGLTAALEVVAAARALDFGIMVGCMVGTSLAMAPAFLLAADAEWVDLDGPVLLDRDREPGLPFDDGVLGPLPPGLWGGGAP